MVAGSRAFLVQAVSENPLFRKTFLKTLRGVQGVQGPGGSREVQQGSSGSKGASKRDPGYRPVPLFSGSMHPPRSKMLRVVSD